MSSVKGGVSVRKDVTIEEVRVSKLVLSVGLDVYVSTVRIYSALDIHQVR